MRVTCPCCQETYPIAAGLADDDGKRLAALFADMEPVLGRAVIGYLRLFKPAKTALRNARAIKIVQELVELVRPGTVCRDERGGLRRPASPVLWAAGIEQMLAAPGKLGLPLANHHYLRAVVFGLADTADAAAERQREADARAGKRRAGPSDNVVSESPLQSQLAWLRQQLEMDRLSREEYDEQVRQAHIRYGASA